MQAIPGMARRMEVSRSQCVFSLRQEPSQVLDLVSVPVESLGELDDGTDQTYADPVFAQPLALVERGVGSVDAGLGWESPSLTLCGQFRRSFLSGLLWSSSVPAPLVYLAVFER